MIVDTSAVVAVVLGEDGHEAVLEALSSSDRKLMSAPTYVELRAVGARRLDVEGCRLLERFLREALIEVVDFSARQAEIAARAYEDYGRGSGHPAGLNLGDAFSYALAIDRNEPLLFVGDDFARTDVRSVL